MKVEEAADFCEIVLAIYQSTTRHIPEGRNIGTQDNQSLRVRNDTF
jgi:hypothetical protein